MRCDIGKVPDQFKGHNRAQSRRRAAHAATVATDWL